jgi:hypothetical protein
MPTQSCCFQEDGLQTLIGFLLRSPRGKDVNAPAAFARFLRTIWRRDTQSFVAVYVRIEEMGQELARFGLRELESMYENGVSYLKRAHRCRHSS